MEPFTLGTFASNISREVVRQPIRIFCNDVILTASVFPFAMADKENVGPLNFSNIDLIQAVKKYPILWDSRLDEYKDVEKKKATWSELSTKFGVAAGTYIRFLSYRPISPST